MTFRDSPSLPWAQNGQSRAPPPQSLRLQYRVAGGRRALQQHTFHQADVIQLYTNAPNCHWHQNGVHVDVCKADPPPHAHGSIVLQCLTVFVPSAKEGPQSMQRRLHCIYLSLQSRLEMVAYIALVQTDTHTNRHRHMLERVSLPFESVCWNQRWNQRYDNLATKPRRQCSALWAALRVLWFTGHVDIPPIALPHTRRHTPV